MKFPNKFKTFLICFLMLGAAAFAQVTEQSQIKVTDDELSKIATIFQGLQTINQEGQQEMAKAVEASGFEMDRFNEMYEASQSPDKDIEATADEKQKYGTVINDLQKIQAGLQKEMEVVITNGGLSMERYQQVATAFQTDQELQARLQAVLTKLQQP